MKTRPTATVRVCATLAGYALILAATLAAPFGARTPARADSHTYASVRRQVRAAILTSSALDFTVNGQQAPENPDPHVFYVMDSRTDLKPLGMEFVNPLAPPVITSTIYQRWKNRVRLAFNQATRTGDPAFVAGTPESQAFQIGAKVTKNMGPYWELNLDTATVSDLENYDILFLHSHKDQAVFSPDDKEKLLKFVEAGGTLWVENCGRLSFGSTDPFLYDVSMSSNFAAGTAFAVIANANHPLLTYPYVLNGRDVNLLGDKYRIDPTTNSRTLLAGYYLYQAANPGDAAPGQNNVNPPGGRTLVPIVWNTRGINPGGATYQDPSWRPLILAGQVGAGRILFASQDSGCTINDYVGGFNAGYGGNSAVISGELFSAASPTDLKFCYNLAAWSTANTTVNNDPRHTGYTIEHSGGALTDKWPTPQVSGTATVGGAVVYKHCIFAVDGNLVLHCYDGRPQTDLDGDGNPDDGIPDYITGVPFDEVWNFNLKSVSNSATGASTPTVMEFWDNNPPAGSSNDRELVVVALSDGTVVALRAFPRLGGAGTPLAPTGIVDWTSSGKVNGLAGYPTTTKSGLPLVPPSVTASEGILFAAANVNGASGPEGRVVAIDPYTGNSAFSPTVAGQYDDVVPGKTPNLPPVIGSPTVGYVKDQASGAIDKVVYLHLGSAPNTTRFESVIALPLGTRGEQLARQGLSSVFHSRSSGLIAQQVMPWYIVDPANPGTQNPALEQRVWAQYTDPATGTVYVKELQYSAGNVPANDQYAAPPLNAPGQVQQVIVGQSVNFGAPVGAIGSNDPNIRIYADYTLDWTAGLADTRQALAARSNLDAPGGNQFDLPIGGPPALGPSDGLYFTVDASSLSGGGAPGQIPAATGGVLAPSEQGGHQTTLPWAWTAHNGFTISKDNNPSETLVVQPRFRQLDPATARLTNTPVGSFIYNVRFVGTPAVRGDTVYAVATGTIGTNGPACSLVCAFRNNVDLRLRLNTTISTSIPQNQIKVRQLNVWAQTGVGVGGQQQSNWTPINNFTVDYESGTIRIGSLGNIGALYPFASTSMPFDVVVGQQEMIIYGVSEDSLVDPNNGTTTVSPHVVGPPGIDNLLWYAVIPSGVALDGKTPVGLVSTSPQIQDTILWLGFATGAVVSLDADPGATDPAAQAAGAQVRLVDNKTGALVHLRWVKQVTASAPILVAPSSVEDVLTVNSAEGPHAYEDAKTIIADGNRLIEVDSAGEAVWTCDATRSYGVAGGDLAQYIEDPNGNIVPVNPQFATGVPAVQKVSFAHPAVVRRIDQNTFLVVDTGNNRVAQVDRGGNIVWEVHRLFDDFEHLMRPGDPLTLNEPTDCAYWTEFIPNMNAWFAANVNKQGFTYSYNNFPGFAVHYLIADSGNFRTIELVDIYNAGGQPVRPQLNGNTTPYTLLRQAFFVSSTFAEGQKYLYRGVVRTLQRNGDLDPNTPFYNPNLPANAIRRFTLTAISNFRLGSGSNAPSDTNDPNQAGGGSIVVMDETGKPISVVTNLAIPDPTVPNGFRLQPISGPTSFSKFDVVDPNTKQLKFHYLLSDANGCYQLVSSFDKTNNTPVMAVEWMLSNQDYYAMTGKQLRASSITRLNTTVTQAGTYAFAAGLHHYLITNRFSGTDNVAVFGAPPFANVTANGETRGEVFELDPTAFDWTKQNHGYWGGGGDHRDYVVAAGNLLVANPLASIVWRTPSELVPPGPPGPTGPIQRFIGSTDRATSTSVLDQPSYADRPF